MAFQTESSSDAASSVTHGNITWTFAGARQTGYFLDGTPYVVRDAAPDDLITKIEKTTSTGVVDINTTALADYNGTVLDPLADDEIGFTKFLSDQGRGTYNSSLNAGRSLPISFSNDDPVSVVTVIENENPEPNGSWVGQAGILTVLASDPAPVLGLNAIKMRPPYCGPKAASYTFETLTKARMADLPTVNLGNFPYDLDDILRTGPGRVGAPWLDTYPGWAGRHLHPAWNMEDYGRDISKWLSVTAFLALSPRPIEAVLAIYMLAQHGLDFYAITQNGGSNNWFGDGGHGQGRMMPMLFAGHILGDTDILEVGAALQEKQQTFYVDSSHVGKGGYTAAHIGMPEWRRTSFNQSHLNSSWGAAYRGDCASTWHGADILLRMLGLNGRVGHPAYFDYIRRHLTQSPLSGSSRSQPGGTLEAWQRLDPLVDRERAAYRTRAAANGVVW